MYCTWFDSLALSFGTAGCPNATQYAETLVEMRFQMSISSCSRALAREIKILVQNEDRDMDIECTRIARALATWRCAAFFSAFPHSR